jgi:hypothetical protein
MASTTYEPWDDCPHGNGPDCAKCAAHDETYREMR